MISFAPRGASFLRHESPRFAPWAIICRRSAAGTIWATHPWRTDNCDPKCPLSNGRASDSLLIVTINVVSLPDGERRPSINFDGVKSTPKTYARHVRQSNNASSGFQMTQASPKPRRSRLAISSLALIGIPLLCWFLIWVCSRIHAYNVALMLAYLAFVSLIVSPVLAIASLVAIHRSRGQLLGKGVAITSICFLTYFASYMYFVRSHMFLGLYGEFGKRTTMRFLVMPDTTVNRCLVTFYAPMLTSVVVGYPIEWQEPGPFTSPRRGERESLPKASIPN